MIRPSETLRGTNLNSVWMEGTLVADAEGAAGPQGTGLRFRIRDHRPLDRDGASVFLVEVPGTVRGGRLLEGQHVRVIGRLKQERHEVRIVGELVESLGP